MTPVKGRYVLEKDAAGHKHGWYRDEHCDSDAATPHGCQTPARLKKMLTVEPAEFRRTSSDS